MLMLAQVQPADFGAWVSNLFYLVGLAAATVVLVQRLRPQKPRATSIADQPVTIRGVVAYTPIEDHKALSARVESLSSEIRHGFDRLDDKRSSSVAGLHDDLEDAINALRKEVREDIGGVHTRVNEVLAAVSELRGRIK